MSANEIHVKWALHGKRPDSSADFGLLAATPGHEKEFSAALFALRPGNPDHKVPAGRADALPWVSIGAFARQTATIGVALVRPAADGRRDKMRRPVAMTSYFEIDYARVAEGPVGYEALRRAVWDVELPEKPGPAVPIRVEPTALADFVEWAAKGLGDVGVDWLVRVAACLLTKPVVIDGGPIDVAQRLSLFDAIAALLPFGMRADLNVSTWVQSQHTENARLAFGAVSDRVLKVVWGKLPNHELSGKPKEYFERVTQLLRRWGTSKTVERLARIRRPLSFAHLDEILDALGELDFAINVAQKIRAGHGNLDEARTVLTRHAPEDLDDGDRETIVNYSVPRLSSAELPALLARYWSPHVRELLAIEALRTSDQERIDAIVEVAVAQPDDSAAESPYEQLLLAVATLVTPDDEAGRRVLLRMIVRFLPPPIGLWPRLRRVLVERPRWCCGLLEAIPAGGNADRSWLTWIVDGDPKQSAPWLVALWSTAFDDRRFAFDDAAELVELGGYAIRAGLLLAVRNGRLAAVLPALWTPILSNALDSHHNDVHQIGHVLRGARHLTPETQAAVDVLLVELAHRLSSVPSDRRLADWQAYQRTAADYLRRVAARAVSPADPAVRFVDAVLAAGLRLAPTDVLCVEFGIGLSTAMAEYQEPMLQHIASVCAPRAVELLTALPDTAQDVMVRYSAELRQVRHGEALRRHAQANEPLPVLARDWLSLVADGGTAADAVQILAGAWPHADDHRLVRWLLDELRREGDARYPGDPRFVDDRYYEGFVAILNGGLGLQVAGDIRQATAAYVHREHNLLERLGELVRRKQPSLFDRLLGRK